MVQVSRRQFMQVTGSSLAASSLAVLGFSPSTALAEVRQFKLTQAKVTRQTCTYCSVGCGLLMYAHGDSVRNVKKPSCTSKATRITRSIAARCAPRALR